MPLPMDAPSFPNFRVFAPWAGFGPSVQVGKTFPAIDGSEISLDCGIDVFYMVSLVHYINPILHASQELAKIVSFELQRALSLTPRIHLGFQGFICPPQFRGARPYLVLELLVRPLN